jgi:hypothetical protein
MRQTHDNSHTKFIDEYKEINEHHRHYGNLRFAQMTLFSVLTGGLVTMFLGQNSLSPFAKTIIKIAGIWLTLMFWLMDFRVISYILAERKRAMEIENMLGYRHQTNTYPLFVKRERTNVLIFYLIEWVLTSTGAIWAIYLGTIVFWILTFIYGDQF